jgi:hypothetical protein
MRQHLHKNRQDPDPLSIPPTFSGLTNAAATVDTTAATQSSLAIDSNAPTRTGLTGLPPTSNVSTRPSEPSNQPSSEANDAKAIPLGTVIAVCLGALVGVVIVVLVAVWLYRRSGRKSRSPHSPLYTSRNTRSEPERLRSRQDRWNKLGDGNADKWETQFPVQTKEVGHGNLAPMEMFKSSTSLHSADKSSDFSHQSHGLDNSFVPYHPQFAEELAKRKLLGRVDSEQPLSWKSETKGSDSILLSIRSKEFSPSGSVSAIRTPPAISHHQSHRWESAKVMHFEDDIAWTDDNTVRNPFSDTASSRQYQNSGSNPFFGGTPDKTAGRSRSRSASRTRSRSSSAASDTNPFSDPEAPVPRLPPSRFMAHESTPSSDYQADRALQSLIAALDVTAEEADQLRVPSMQSMTTSMTTSDDCGDDRVESISAFPLPPTDVPPSPKIH